MFKIYVFVLMSLCCGSITKLHFNNKPRTIQEPNINRSKSTVYQRLKSIILRKKGTSKKFHRVEDENNSDVNLTGAKSFRDVSFWLRASHIYTSYKYTQMKTKVKSLLLFSRRRKSGQQKEDTWLKLHEINSNRMMRLCLGLKGFYLKTGQFLGTRHDFMPTTYTRKLSRLHDSVPPLSEYETRKNIERELNGTLEEYFTSFNLTTPIGCASIAQVHQGIWKKTGEKVAVKIQFPHAEKLMKSDLKNLRRLAEFLQKTEFKFDLLSSIIELQKQIHNEFDFILEANNMEFARKRLAYHVPEVQIPRPIFATKRLLVMSFIEGTNLGKLAEFRDKNWHGSKIPRWQRDKFAINLLNTLAKAWGHQIFTLKMFNADPHPGNICLQKGGKIGLLDWGQVKKLSDDILMKFSLMVDAINSRQVDNVIKAFYELGIEVTNPSDRETVHKMALTMLDTKVVPGFLTNPFSNPMETLKNNSVSHIPTDLYFIVRTIQLFRGITYAFDLDYSIAERWGPLAQRAIVEINQKKLNQV